MDELGGLAKPAVASAKLAAAARTSTRPAKAVQPLATVRSLRARIFLTLEDPTSSVTAKVISGFILSVIILSICTYCAGTMLVYAGPDGRPGTCPEPSLGGYLVEGDRVVACDPFALDGNATASAGCTPCSFPDAAWWARLEMLCAIVFSIEYVSRLLCCPTARLPSWVVEPLNVLDLVSIAPWYLEQFVIEQGTHTQVVRALRLLRIFRMAKQSKKFAFLEIFARTMQLSWAPLGMTALLVMIACTLFSSLVWFAERGEWDAQSKQWLREDGSPSPFESIPAAMWWCIVTFTTVGYGDMAPVTPTGRAFGVLAMFVGLLVIALPASVIGTTFESVFAQVTLGEKLAERGLAPLEDDDDDSLRAEQRVANASFDNIMGGGGDDSPKGGGNRALSMSELSLAKSVFPRWEARAQQMVLFTEQLGGLLHQLEVTCEHLEALCNEHGPGLPQALHLPPSPRNQQLKHLYQSRDDLIGEEHVHRPLSAPSGPLSLPPSAAECGTTPSAATSSPRRKPPSWNSPTKDMPS